MDDARGDADPMMPLDLSHYCDGERMEFPLGLEVQAAKVLLNDVYLAEGLDFGIGQRENQSVLHLRRAPNPGDRLLVMRVPAPTEAAERESWSEARQRWRIELPYEQLPQLVKDNISAEQWVEAQRGVILDGDTVPETTAYINLKNGQIHTYTAGQSADGPLLPAHDLAGGRGKNSTQYESAPRGSHGVP